MKTNTAAIELIKRNEGCILHAYRDMVGILTIGFGHIEGVQEGQTITQAEADQMLLDDLNNDYGPKVAARIGNYPTTANQFGAMVSLAYNVGVGGFGGSTVARQHCAGNYAAAAQAFLLWDQAGGHPVAALLRRRGEERDLYLTPDTAAPAEPPSPQAVPDYAGDWIRRGQAMLGVTVDGDPGTETEGAWQAWRTAHLGDNSGNKSGGSSLAKDKPA